MVIYRILEVFLLSALTHGYYAWEHASLQHLAVDLGENLTLPCSIPSGDGSREPDEDFDPSSVAWIYEGMSGQEKHQKDRISPDGSLSLTELHKEDAGVYACTVDSGATSNGGQGGGVRARVKVHVRTPPPALANVTVRPSTVLALLLWDVAEDGGYPIAHFEARYKLKTADPESWHIVAPDHISSNVRQIDVYHLQPNSTYLFQIRAVNQLGPGEISEKEAQTHFDSEEIELARHLLEGAESFDTRYWVAAVVVVMGTLVVLAVGTFYLLYKECKLSAHLHQDEEIIELIPNIILNPAYDVETSEQLEPDENFNDHLTMRLNNNSVVQPAARV